jgi:hypothetical protein
MDAVKVAEALIAALLAAIGPTSYTSSAAGGVCRSRVPVGEAASLIYTAPFVQESARRQRELK